MIEIASRSAAAPPGAQHSSAQSWIEVVERPADLERYLAPWQELAEHALEPNVFYEPWQLRPALSNFGAEHRSVFVFVFRRTQQPKAQPFAIGFFPWQRRNRFRGWPVNMLSAWRHLMALLSTPLLHAEFAHEAWSAMIAWAGARSSAVSLLEFPLLAAEGPVHQALVDVVYELGCLTYEAEKFNRAFLVCRDDDGLGYQRRGIASGILKELRRQRNRLGETGRLELRSLAQDGDVSVWIDQFEMLEAGGWKGKRATALRSIEKHSTYFRSICVEAFTRRRLHMLGHFLDDKPVAMKCNFLAGDGAFALKIAFDERYAKYSPGAQLELDNIVDVHRRSEVSWMDSCAAPSHPMIDRIWSERRTITHLLLAPGGWKGASLLALFPCLRAIKRMLKRK